MNRPYARTPALLFGSLLLLAASTAWSAAYRWTDADGNVQYGDQPPTGVAAERLRPPPPPPLSETDHGTVPQAASGEVIVEQAGQASDTSGAEGEKSDPAQASEQALKAEQQRQEIARQNAEIARQNAQKKKANCATARSNLQRLQQNRPVRVYDENSPSYRGRRLTAEEREEALREAQRQIRENCN